MRDLQSGICLGLRGGIAFEVEAQTVNVDLHSGEQFAAVHMSIDRSSASTDASWLDSDSS